MLSVCDLTAYVLSANESLSCKVKSLRMYYVSFIFEAAHDSVVNNRSQYCIDTYCAVYHCFVRIIYERIVHDSAEQKLMEYLEEPKF